MKIEEYIRTLPDGIISGQQVQLPEGAIREILEFADMKKDDIFYHLGSGDGAAVEIAVKEFGVRRATGIDNDRTKIEAGRARMEGLQGAQLQCADIRQADISDATVILFWFACEDIVEEMTSRFSKLGPGCRIVTIWAPLPGYLPDRVEFPYIMSKIPLRPAASLQDQLLAVLGVSCIDFVTAWEHAERYTRAIGSPEAKNDRFLTIMQTLVIWINARNLGVACTDDIPESISTYIKILDNYFGIQVGHLLEKP